MGNRHDCPSCPRYEPGVACASGYHKPCQDHLAARENERRQIAESIAVRTEHVFPPIPIRDYDWSAVDDRTFDGPGSPVGWGGTERQAIDDLIEQIQDQT